MEMPGATSFQRQQHLLRLQLSLPEWRCKGARKEGFLHPTCPRRVRAHTSVIYHRASSACQPDKDFSPGASKLEMLFRLPKQLHVFCFPSQRRAASMQMKGCGTCQGCGHSTSLRPGRALRDGGSSGTDTTATRAQLSLQRPAVHKKQFPLASASAIDYFLPFFFFSFSYIP